jgi:hypothetical protein
MTAFDPIPDLKRQVGAEIARLIAERSNWDAAVWLGTDSPRITDLKRGRLDRFSLVTLLRYAAKLRRRPKLIFEDPAWPPLRARESPPSTGNR